MKLSELASLADCLADPIVICDEQSAIAACNQPAATLFGYNVGDLLGKPLSLLLPEHLGQHHAGLVADFVGNERVAVNMSGRGAIQCRKQGGDLFLARISIASIKSGNSCYGLAIIQDISADMAEQRKIRYQSEHDSLTGLNNRFYLEEKLCQLRDTEGSVFTLLYMDLDGFKKVNDTLGHQMGDRALQIIARRMLHVVRQSDELTRVGGDEFVLLLMGRVERDKITEICETLRGTVERPIHIGVAVADIGLSIGISNYPSNGRTPTAVLATADSAMYRAKRAKRLYCFAESVD